VSPAFLNRPLVACFSVVMITLLLAASGCTTTRHETDAIALVPVNSLAKPGACR